MRRAERHSSGLFDFGACLPGRAQLGACQLISLLGCRHPGCARSPTRGARCGLGWCRTGPKWPRLPVQAWRVDHHPIRATPGYRPARPVACTGRPQPPRRRYRVLTPCAEDAGSRMLPSWCASEQDHLVCPASSTTLPHRRTQATVAVRTGCCPSTDHAATDVLVCPGRPTGELRNRGRRGGPLFRRSRTRALRGRRSQCLPAQCSRCGPGPSARRFNHRQPRPHNRPSDAPAVVPVDCWTVAAWGG